MRISDWSSDVCSSDLATTAPPKAAPARAAATNPIEDLQRYWDMGVAWVNGHWLQIGIAIGAGLVIYLLLSLLRRIALKHAQSTEGGMTQTLMNGRPEERRVGQAWVSTGRSRWSMYHKKKKHK